MPESLVVSTLRKFQNRLSMKESDLMDEMGLRWLRVERSLDAEITALAYEMERRAAAGEIITEAMIRRSARYATLQRQMLVEIRKYNVDAVDTITVAQEDYATLGISASQSAIIASFNAPSAEDAQQWTRINTKAVESMFGFAGDGSPLSMLLVKDYGEASDGLLNALVDGLARGYGPEKIARLMSDGMGMGLDRALLIARTETLRAYRTGSTEQYRQSGVVTGFKRLVNKETACLGCLLLDGEHFDVEGELDDHPNGKCSCVPEVAGVDSPSWEFGADWFENQPESFQRELMGNEKFELWQSGIDLARFATHTHSTTWGSSPRPATVEELTA